MQNSTRLCIAGFVLFAFAIVSGSVWNNFFVVGNGVKVVGFMKESPAKIAGIVENDIILAIDGQQVMTTKDFVQVMKSKLPSQSVLVKITAREIPVALGREPILGSARLGIFVETVKSYPVLPLHADFTVESVLTLVYWLGIIHLVGGFALLFGKTAPFTEFLALNFLNVLDLVSTRFFLEAGRVEGNPAGLFLLENLGFTGTAVLKIIVVLAGSALFVWFSNRKRWKYPSLARTLISKHRVHLRGTILLYMLAVLVNVGVII